MRIQIKTSRNEEKVPFDYQQLLIGAFHKWCGKNNLHDELSLYSISWLRGSKSSGDALAFPHGSHWFISSYDANCIRKVLAGILSQPQLFSGMKVTNVQICETPNFGPSYRFSPSGPILAKYWDGSRLKHLTFSDAEADKVLTKTLHSKLGRAGLSTDGVSVRFDRDYPKARTKMVSIKGIQNRASLCPVFVEGSPEAVAFAWDVGVGHCTGSCFGALQ